MRANLDRHGRKFTANRAPCRDAIGEPGNTPPKHLPQSLASSNMAENVAACIIGLTLLNQFLLGDIMKMDPVCLTEIDDSEAYSYGLSTVHLGRRYFFCSEQCKKDFDDDPKAFIVQGRDISADAHEQRPDDYI